jgi:hypothetical protein
MFHGNISSDFVFGTPILSTGIRSDISRINFPGDLGPSTDNEASHIFKSMREIWG